MILELHNEGLSVSAISQRLGECPDLSAARLLREITDLGYRGCYSSVKQFVAQLRPSMPTQFEVRFETPAGQQAQVDFAHFQTVFSDEPGQLRRVWLFSMVLGHSRYLWAQYVTHQDFATVLRCHAQAFEHFGGVPREILYDRMKTAVLGERYDGSHIVYNAKLLSCAKHYGFTPKACKAYRAKTKGKGQSGAAVSLHSARFFYGPRVCQLSRFKPAVAPLAGSGRFDAVLRLERRITNDGCVSVGGNLYSVPNGTRRRPVDVELTAHEVRISEQGQVVAVHRLLAGSNERSVLPGHRLRLKPERTGKAYAANFISPTGHQVARRDLQIYDAIAAKLASLNRSATPLFGQVHATASEAVQQAV